MNTRHHNSRPPSVLFVIAAGRGSIGDRQMRSLAEEAGVPSEFIYVDKKIGARADVARLARAIASTENDVVIVKGLGWRAGVAALLAKRRTKGARTYFVTAGDAVGSYERNNHGRIRGWLGDQFERMLYRQSEGFIGRTGYFVGRAIRMGAPSGVTIEGFASPLLQFTGRAPAIRESLGIPADALVVGVSGTINWSARQHYGYGFELVNAAKHLKKSDVYFIVVGDGAGLQRLKEAARDDDRFRFVGRVSHTEIGDFMQVFDVAVISQTRDETGLLRTTTKMPEYFVAGVPIIMSSIPAAFDYVDHSLTEPPVVVVPSGHPASEEYAKSLAQIIQSVSRDEWKRRGRNAARAVERFDLAYVAARLVPYLRVESRRSHG